MSSETSYPASAPLPADVRKQAAVDAREFGAGTRDQVTTDYIAAFRTQDFHRELVRALAQACRDGLPADVQEGYIAVVASDVGGGQAVIDLAQNERNQLERERQHLEDLAESILNEVLACRPGEDVRKQRLREKEYEARDGLDRVVRELAELERASALPAPERIITLGSQLDFALRNLVRLGDSVTQRVRHALDTVLTDLRVEHDEHGQWWGTTYMLLPIPGSGLARFGPIRWQLGSGGRGTQTARVANARNLPRAAREHLIRRLCDHEDRVPPAARTRVLASVFSELPYVLLNGLEGYPFPEWVGSEWRQPTFVEWIVTTYTNSAMLRGSYLQRSHLRQLIAYLADEKGTIGAADVVATVGVRSPRFMRIYAENFMPQGGSRLWHGPVEIDPDAAGHYRSVRCRCGANAVLVVRTAETPRDLLCGTCLRMPDAKRFGMDPEMRFPRAYADELVLSKTACVAELQRKNNHLDHGRPEIQGRILGLADYLRVGIRLTDIGRLLNVSPQTLDYHLRALASQGRLGFPSTQTDLWYLAGHDPLGQPSSDLQGGEAAFGPNVSALPREAVTNRDGWEPAHTGSDAVHNRVGTQSSDGADLHRLYGFLGPYVPPQVVFRSLGLTQAGLRWRRREGRVLALPAYAGFHVFPAWQFSHDGEVSADLQTVFAVLRGIDPWTAATWLSAQHPALEGRTPRQELSAGVEGSRLAALAEMDIAELCLDGRPPKSM